MPHPLRPRRSALFVPVSNARALAKAPSLPADVVIFDLEDSVAPAQKDAARSHVLEVLARPGWRPRELVIRVNRPDGAWGAADLKAVARSGADAVLIPKIESAEQVRDAALRLAAAGAPPDLALWSMMETPRAILRAEEIAFSTPHLACLVMGTADLAKDLRAVHTRDRLPLVFSLSLCVLAARAAGLAILDGVHFELQDEAGFAAACRQGAELGFDGKTLIHPSTIAAANQIFGPSAAELEWSRKIIDAHAAAVAAGQGVAVVDGQLIEELHVENAKRLMALTAIIHEREQALASR